MTRPRPSLASRTATAVVLTLLWVRPARAQDAPDVAPPQPVLSSDVQWVRPTLLAIGGLFAAAATVGPVVWLRARNTVPAAATHEEDPAADRH